jgi:hypothetical protein
LGVLYDANTPEKIFLVNVDKLRIIKA